MEEKQFYLVRVQATMGSSPYLSIQEVACRCGVHPELIDRFVRLGLIDLAERNSDGEAFFPAEVPTLVRRILRLRNDLGVNYAGIGVILDLVARIEALEDHIRAIERRAP